MSFAVARSLHRPLSRSFTSTSTSHKSPRKSPPRTHKTRSRTPKVDRTTEPLLPLQELRAPFSFNHQSNEATSNDVPPLPRKARTPKVDPTTESLLSPQKLRALVSLYHQSEDFITEETLLDRIDAAFVGGDTHQRGTINQLEQRWLEDVLKNQREAPRIAPWYHELTSLDRKDQFSGQMTSREKQIVDALYGVESGSRVGYETLMEAVKAKKMEPEQE
ncbi:hypothetical protein AGABI2DRAFT_177634 [Agaricus bisporus var. bisporus H97]|uniref:hypothetical protein n=1 Tax=Agaricus bisporus var. bisporus (strain H97 / ATCC MYA-4626 / FGSC 10389) TaxID=936046 RepID=UPI00029F6A25|nr:hypothetical protein AGABI2DRAFT_177634 [Agaricus bisporus var. bisporus H97]EKV48029.1 hypothetical protein AGABI2DRAFT_177634 [Agaricus bisporus var. bisporus H97]